MDAPVRRCENFDSLCHTRSRGSPKKSWREVIRYDMKTLRLVEDMTQDKSLWRSRIKIADKPGSYSPFGLRGYGSVNACV